ncbi:MAG TPA: GNAT family N-acetyltransferase [Allosphingosinicella sp.]|nr:GNAT family N-acetyltransferase [Allosphingosinicella sp.]
MTVTIRPYLPADRDAALAICIAAFTPIHEGFRAALGETIFALHYPDWQGGYANMFDALAEDDGRTEVFVAEADGEIAGFCFAILDAGTKTGEVGLNAVAPAQQRRGVGRRLYEHALARLKARGAEIAYVGTGGDAAHEPARRAYEALGFDRVIPAVHYYREL